MKSLENSCRDGSATWEWRGTPHPPIAGRSTGFGLNVAKYRSAKDSPKLIANVSGLKPSSDSDSVMLARVGVRNWLGDSSAGVSGAREAMLVLTTGLSAGGEARRGGDGARPHGSEAGGVPGEVPGTADCYGHCWNSGKARLVKQ